MAKVTPDEAAANWAQKLAGAGDRITRGVQSVTTSPGQAAARQKAAYTQNVAAAADKWASRVASVSVGDWQQAVIEKGVPRIAAGAQAAQPKMAQFMGQILPHIDSVKGSLPARGNLDQNIARMTAFTRGMAKFQRR
jgi:hypothetical protein